MTSQAEIYAALSEIFRETFDDDALELTHTLTAADVPEWDSFNHINLIVATEMKFGIKFRTAEIEELKDVGEFAALVEKKLQAKKA